MPNDRTKWFSLKSSPEIGNALPDIATPSASRVERSDDKRMHYLDAFRAFCMLYGVLLHAPVIVGDPSGGWISTGSSYFRMPGFFVIAGFFSTMVYLRMDYGAFLKQRSVFLMVPFLTTLILANPISFVLIAQHYNHSPPLVPSTFFTEKLGPRETYVWHLHLWFLISLMVYTLCIPLAILIVDWLKPILSKIESKPVFAAVGVIALFTGVACVFGRAAASLLDQLVLHGSASAYVFVATLRFAPYFFLGVILFRHSMLLEKFTRSSIPLLTITTATLLVTVSIEDAWESQVTSIVLVMVRSVAIVVFVSFLFRIFHALFNRKNPIIRFLVDASFTLYLLHFLCITMIGYIILPQVELLGAQTWIAYILVVIVTFAATLAFHGFLVTRSDTLRFLLNGKRKRS